MFLTVGAEFLRVRRPGGFVVTWRLAAVRGCGCRSRATRRVREVSCERGFGWVSQQPSAAYPPAACPAVGRLMSRQHVVDFGDAAVWAADHGESVEREGGPCGVSEQMLERSPPARQRSACRSRTRRRRSPACWPSFHWSRSRFPTSRRRSPCRPCRTGCGRRHRALRSAPRSSTGIRSSRARRPPCRTPRPGGRSRRERLRPGQQGSGSGVTDDEGFSGQEL